ncbi:MAG: helix-turn-helix domain-containing protein [Bacteroidota bacterium]
MEYHINIYNLLICFAMVQGFIFGGILLWGSKFNQANKYLGLTVIFLSLYLFWVLKYDFGVQKQIPHLQFLPVLYLWGIGPAFYAYIKFSFGQLIPKKELRLHFLPLLLEILFFNGCTVLGYANGFQIENFNKIEYFIIDNLFSIEHIIGLISIAIYLVKCFQFLSQMEIKHSHKRLYYILFSFSLLWVIWLPYTLYDSWYFSFNFPPSDFYSFYILFSALTYSIGFWGFKMKNSTNLDNKVSKLSKEKTAPLISPQMYEQAKTIISYMDKKQCYLDPELTLRDFAQDLGLHPNRVSTIVNQVLEKPFRDFLNTYRIELFKSKIAEEGSNNKTLLGLAYESGFNSKATFNRAFKKQEGVSPNEYVEKIGLGRTQNA